MIRVEEVPHATLMANIDKSGLVTNALAAGFSVHQDAPEFQSAYQASYETYKRFLQWHAGVDRAVLQGNSAKDPWHIYCLFFAVQVPSCETPPDPFAPFEPSNEDQPEST